MQGSGLQRTYTGFDLNISHVPQEMVQGCHVLLPSWPCVLSLNLLFSRSSSSQNWFPIFSVKTGQGKESQSIYHVHGRLGAAKEN